MLTITVPVKGKNDGLLEPTDNQARVSNAHNSAKRAFMVATGRELPAYAKQMTLEQKKDYLCWLEKYAATIEKENQKNENS